MKGCKKSVDMWVRDMLGRCKTIPHVETVVPIVMSAIDMMVESLKRIILDNRDEKLILPTVLPIESTEGITE